MMLSSSLKRANTIAARLCCLLGQRRAIIAATKVSDRRGICVDRLGIEVPEKCCVFTSCAKWLVRQNVF